MGKKRRNYINVKETTEFLMQAYNFTVKKVNDYHLRVRHVEFDGWFDWYHTTGTVVRNSRGIDGQFYCSKFTQAEDAEELAQVINKEVYRLLQ